MGYIFFNSQASEVRKIDIQIKGDHFVKARNAKKTKLYLLPISPDASLINGSELRLLTNNDDNKGPNGEPLLIKE